MDAFGLAVMERRRNKLIDLYRDDLEKNLRRLLN